MLVSVYAYEHWGPIVVRGKFPAVQLKRSTFRAIDAPLSF